MRFTTTFHLYLAILLVVGSFITTSEGYAYNFYGADVFDTDVPSVYFRVGLYGPRPIVSTVAFDSIADKLGLRRGNIILAVNGEDILETSQLKQFSSNVLSVLIISGFEIKALTIDRLAAQTGKSNARANTKKSDRQNRSVIELPTPPPGTPAVSIRNTTSENAPGKPVQQEQPMPQTSFEVVARLIQPAEVSAKGKSLNKEQPPTIQEKPEKRPGTEISKISEKAPASSPTSPSVVATKSDIFTTPIKPAYDRIMFENSKGDVSFKHSTHLKSLNREQCMLCHWSANPTLGSIQSRLANHRTAHSLCRGCHQKMESGPTGECYQCHNGGNRN